MSLSDNVFAVGRAALDTVQKPTFDFAAMQEIDRREMWPEIIGYCSNPCAAVLTEHLNRSMYSDDVRREHHKRRMQRAELNRELRTAVSR